MHSPTGLGVYGLYQNEASNGAATTDVFYVKPFVKTKWWGGLGGTTWFGEYAQYNDQFASLSGVDQCGAGVWASSIGSNVGNFCAANAVNTLVSTGSEVERWGLGVVQEIDAAAMHLWARWQYQDLELDLVGTNAVGAKSNISQGFDTWNLIQVGGVIFF